MKERDIENLVFAGGGLKGFIHIGALQVLEENSILTKCKRFCGASIGSFFALLLCIGIRVVDIERFAEIGRRNGVLTLIDATLSTPYNVKPLEAGVDFVLQAGG